MSKTALKIQFEGNSQLKEYQNVTNDAINQHSAALPTLPY